MKGNLNYDGTTVTPWPWSWISALSLWNLRCGRITNFTSVFRQCCWAETTLPINVHFPVRVRRKRLLPRFAYSPCVYLNTEPAIAASCARDIILVSCCIWLGIQWCPLYSNSADSFEFGSFSNWACVFKVETRACVFFVWIVQISLSVLPEELRHQISILVKCQTVGSFKIQLGICTWWKHWVDIPRARIFTDLKIS